MANLRTFDGFERTGSQHVVVPTMRHGFREESVLVGRMKKFSGGFCNLKTTYKSFRLNGMLRIRLEY